MSEIVGCFATECVIQIAHADAAFTVVGTLVI